MADQKDTVGTDINGDSITTPVMKLLAKGRSSNGPTVGPGTPLPVTIDGDDAARIINLLTEIRNALWAIGPGPAFGENNDR